MVRVTHNAGFFSCCSVRLDQIVAHYNRSHSLPKVVDSSEQFLFYKVNPKDDVTFVYFEDYDKMDVQIPWQRSVNYGHRKQFDNYKRLDYQGIIPFIHKYFTPTQEIHDIKAQLISKYNIVPEDTVAVYFRGTDKHIETKLGNFKSYSEKLDQVLLTNPDSQILVQTDSQQFLDQMKNKYNNIICFSENRTSNTNAGIHHENSTFSNHHDIKTLFATFLIFAKCKNILCGISNCSIWTMFYRENADGVHQYSYGKWL